jgi:hypothetical protein
VRYLSILPTNHAIDFMVGFFGPFTCGATVVHLRTLRPEYVREAFAKYKITYVSLVPLVLKNLHKGLQARFDALQAGKRKVFDALVRINRAVTKDRPLPIVSRFLLKEVPRALAVNSAPSLSAARLGSPRICSFSTIWEFRSPTATASPKQVPPSPSTISSRFARTPSASRCPAWKCASSLRTPKESAKLPCAARR